MIITVDIGNSRIKSAQWKGGVIIARNVAAYDKVDAGDVDNSLVFDSLFESLQKPARVLAVCVAHDHMRTALDEWVQKNWQLEVEFLKTGERYGDIVNAYADPAKHVLIVGQHWLLRNNLCLTARSASSVRVLPSPSTCLKREGSTWVATSCLHITLCI